MTHTSNNGLWLSLIGFGPAAEKPSIPNVPPGCGAFWIDTDGDGNLWAWNGSAWGVVMQTAFGTTAVVYADLPAEPFRGQVAYVTDLDDDTAGVIANDGGELSAIVAFNGENWIVGGSAAKVSHAVTYSELPGSPYAGQVAYVSDLLVNTGGVVAAAGGAAKGLVAYDGADWIVGGCVPRTSPAVAFASLPGAPYVGQVAYVSNLVSNVVGTVASGPGALTGLVAWNGANWIVGGCAAPA